MTRQQQLLNLKRPGGLTAEPARRPLACGLWGYRVAILLFPFVAFAWMLPWLTGTTLGNDYVVQPIHEQLYLQYALRSGVWPLYVAGYAGGQSASALTAGQLLHPLANISAHLPGYWTGGALDWNTFLRLLSLGFAHLALFTALLRLQRSALMATLLSGIAVYNLRMLDLFRYGMALESYTGFVFLAAAMIWSVTDGHRWFAAAPVAAAVYWLVTSGHPQHAYTAMMGAAVLTVLLPWLAVQVGAPDREATQWPRYWARMAATGCTGLLCAAAYWLPFGVDFLPTNAGRVDSSYGWALAFGDTLTGLSNNFFHPLRADVHGAFGGSSLILLATLLPLLPLFRIRVPLAVWGVWAASFTAFLYMLGDRTFIHPLAYRFVPFLSAMRVPGRVALVLPTFLVLVLVWVTQDRGPSRRVLGRDLEVNAQVILATLALVAMGLHCLLPESITWNMTPFAPFRIRKLPSWIDWAAFAAGAASVAALAAHGLARERLRAMAVAATVLAALQVCLLLPFGTWVAARTPSLTAARIAELFRRQAEYPVVPLAEMYHKEVAGLLSNAFLEPALAKLLTRAFVVANSEDAFRILRAGRHQEDVAVETDDRAAVQSIIDAPACDGGRIELGYNSFNRFAFDVESCSPAVLQLSLPYSTHWQASVNGTEVRAYRVNGGQLGVLVPAGKSRVDVRYWSRAAYAGVIVSLATLALLLSYVAARKLRARSAVVVAAVLLVAAGLVAKRWVAHLYSGQSLGTTYAWQRTERQAAINLAYGKRAFMSSTPLVDQLAHRNHASRGVDGNSHPGSGFATKDEIEPTWTVDLDRAAMIDRMVLYFSPRPAETRTAIDVLISDDEDAWRLIGTVPATDASGEIRLQVQPPTVTRFVRLRGQGKSRLALDEVEVFGPDAPVAIETP